MSTARSPAIDDMLKEIDDPTAQKRAGDLVTQLTGWGRSVPQVTKILRKRVDRYRHITEVKARRRMGEEIKDVAAAVQIHPGTVCKYQKIGDPLSVFSYTSRPSVRRRKVNFERIDRIARARVLATYLSTGGRLPQDVFKRIFNHREGAEKFQKALSTILDYPVRITTEGSGENQRFQVMCRSIELTRTLDEVTNGKTRLPWEYLVEEDERREFINGLLDVKSPRKIELIGRRRKKSLVSDRPRLRIHSMVEGIGFHQDVQLLLKSVGLLTYLEETKDRQMFILGGKVDPKKLTENFKALQLEVDGEFEKIPAVTPVPGGRRWTAITNKGEKWIIRYNEKGKRVRVYKGRERKGEAVSELKARPDTREKYSDKIRIFGEGGFLLAVHTQQEMRRIAEEGLISSEKLTKEILERQGDQRSLGPFDIEEYDWMWSFIKGEDIKNPRSQAMYITEELNTHMVTQEILHENPLLSPKEAESQARITLRTDPKLRKRGYHQLWNWLIKERGPHRLKLRKELEEIQAQRPDPRIYWLLYRGLGMSREEVNAFASKEKSFSKIVGKFKDEIRESKGGKKLLASSIDPDVGHENPDDNIDLTTFAELSYAPTEKLNVICSARRGLNASVKQALAIAQAHPKIDDFQDAMGYIRDRLMLDPRRHLNWMSVPTKKLGLLNNNGRSMGIKVGSGELEEDALRLIQYYPVLLSRIPEDDERIDSLATRVGRISEKNNILPANLVGEINSLLEDQPGLIEDDSVRERLQVDLDMLLEE
ncbi:MAG: hypothetical protein ABH950_06450 [Candidatus Altiarchaeota archaeon]